MTARMQNAECRMQEVRCKTGTCRDEAPERSPVLPVIRLPVASGDKPSPDAGLQRWAATDSFIGCATGALSLAVGESEDRQDACPTKPLAFVWLLLLFSPSLLAQTTNVALDPDEIPPFRPAKPELPPSFWEQYGLWVVLGGVALLVMAAALWRFIVSRPPPPEPLPAETARAALASLASAHPQPAGIATPALADRVSAILRTYFVAVLKLPAPQPTNRELAAELRSQPQFNPEFREQAGAFVLALDEQRFDPQATAPMPDAVQKAVTLVEQTEAALLPPASKPPEAGEPIP